jgi:tetratricopeptide (TPR) repeat protein
MALLGGLLCAAVPAAAAASDEAPWLLTGWQGVHAAPDAASARRALKALEAEGLARGVLSLPAPALALVRARDGDIKLPAAERIAWATRLAPESAAVHFAAARAAVTVDPGAAISLYARAFGTMRRDFGYLAGLVSRLAAVALVGLALAFTVFGASALLRHGGGALHDLGHLFPVILPRSFGIAAGVALAGLPLMLGLGWIWLPVFWVLGVWGTLPRNKRWIALGFLLLVAAAQPIAGAMAALLPVPEAREELAAVLRARAGAARENDRAVLEEGARRGDPIALFALSNVERERGRPEEAARALRRALEVRPGWTAAQNNLAILRMEANDVPEAEALLKDALAREPGVRLQYNLSYLYRRAFRLDEAEAAFRRAREIDADAVDRFIQLADGKHGSNQASIAVPADLGQEDLWRMRLEGGPGGAALPAKLAAPFLGAVPLPLVAPVVAGLFAAALLLTRALSRKGRAGKCCHCGAEVCPACYGTELREGVCLPCHIIYVQGERVDEMAKLAQDQRVKRYRLELRRGLIVAGALVPGLGHLLLGFALRGAGLLVVACVAAYAPIGLALSGVGGGLWSPLAAAPLGGLLALAGAAAALAALGLGTRDLMKRLRPI